MTMTDNCEPINVSQLHSLRKIITLKAVFVNNSTNAFFLVISFHIRERLHFSKAVDIKSASFYCVV